MTKERMLELVYNCADPLTKEAERNRMLSQMAEALSAEIRAATAKSEGRGNAQKCAEKILKTIRSERPERTALLYPWIDSAGRQVFTDTYQAYRLRKHLPLEARPEDNFISPDYMGNLFDYGQNYANIVEMPSAAELKAHIKIERAKSGKTKTVEWDFGEGLPLVNAEFLLNIRTILPEVNELRCEGFPKPLYGTCDDGDVVILHMHRKAVK